VHKKKTYVNMNSEVIDRSGGSARQNRHFTRMSNQGDLLRLMVLDIKVYHSKISVSSHELSSVICCDAWVEI